MSGQQPTRPAHLPPNQPPLPKPNTTTPAVLGKYEIGRVSSYEFPRYKEDTRGFYKALCQRVGAYFEENKINPKVGFRRC